MTVLAPVRNRYNLSASITLVQTTSGYTTLESWEGLPKFESSSTWGKSSQRILDRPPIASLEHPVSTESLDVIIDIRLAFYIDIVSPYTWCDMAVRKEVRWFELEPPHKSRPSTTSGDRPLPSPYPFPATVSWTMKSVLSIDGGGIRAYSSLVILQALMDAIGEIEQAHNSMATSSIYSSALGPLDDRICANPGAMPQSEYWPCHYFDYIGGVGTGGIIAMMLGRCRMSVGEAMERYREMCATVVERQLTGPKPRSVRRRPVLLANHRAPRWSNARAVKLVPAWPSLHECEGDLESDPQRCSTIVCGCDSQLQPFRSYPGSEPRRHAINDVILGCLPANPPLGTYIDGKYSYNNPSRTLLTDVSSLLDSEKCGDYSIDLLSIGAAISEPVNIKSHEMQYQMSKQNQRVHNELTQADPLNLNNYCRLESPDHNIQDIGVNEWKPEISDHSSFDRIEEATNVYLQENAIVDKLHHFAAALVDKRRLRAETLRWERWALGITYRCPKLECKD